MNGLVVVLELALKHEQTRQTRSDGAASAEPSLLELYRVVTELEVLKGRRPQPSQAVFLLFFSSSFNKIYVRIFVRFMFHSFSHRHQPAMLTSFNMLPCPSFSFSSYLCAAKCAICTQIITKKQLTRYEPDFSTQWRFLLRPKQIDQALKEFKLIQEGKLQARPAEEL